jgi:hypothetical protein
MRKKLNFLFAVGKKLFNLFFFCNTERSQLIERTLKYSIARGNK